LYLYSAAAPGGRNTEYRHIANAFTLAAIMTTINLYTLLLLITLTVLLSCSDNKKTQLTSQTINSNEGIAIDTLNFIYDGPKNFTLDYFPKNAVHSAMVKECEITEQDSSSKRISRIVQFDKSGNIVKDENNFFSYWFEGTVRGKYNYQYDETGRKLIMKGIPQEDSKDSIMTIWNYTTAGLLFSRNDYEFAKMLKPGADRHLPNPKDYEKYPTWNKLQSYQFSQRPDSVTIEMFADKKSVTKENYQLLFDTSKKLKAVNKFENGSLVETTDYTHEANSITEFIKRKMNDGKEWTYKSKTVFNDKGYLIEKIVFNDDESEKVKMIVSYNTDGTIKNINYSNTVQEFKYSYY